MWLALVAVAAGGVAGLATGGRADNVRHFRLRWIGLLLAGAICEFVGSRWGSGPLGLTILVAGYVLLVGFAGRNAARVGMILIAAGLLANLLVIGVDGGMPVRGLPAGVTAGPRHHGDRPSDRLTVLADVVPLRPLRQTVSAGDLVLALGVATAVAGALRSRPPHSGPDPTDPATRSPAGNMDRWST